MFACTLIYHFLYLFCFRFYSPNDIVILGIKNIAEHIPCEYKTGSTAFACLNQLYSTEYSHNANINWFNYSVTHPILQRFLSPTSKLITLNILFWSMKRVVFRRHFHCLSKFLSISRLNWKAIDPKIVE